MPSEHILKYMLAMLLGIAVIYIVGIPYLFAIVKFYLGKPFSLWKAIQIGMLPFAGLDILKGLLAALVARALKHRLCC
jgi:biotin transport system substrate-specific component